MRPFRILTVLAAICALACSKKPAPTSQTTDADVPRAATSEAATATTSRPPPASAPAPEASSAPEPAPPPAPDPPDPPEARASARATPGDIFDDYGLPAYAGLEHLCGRRERTVDGDSSNWDAFVSAEPPDRLVGAYKRRLGDRGFRSEGLGGVWRIGMAGAERTLTISTPDAEGKHSGCAAKPSPHAKSVVIISR